VFSNLFSITLPNIEKYFPGIHFPKGNYFPANKRGYMLIIVPNNKEILFLYVHRTITINIRERENENKLY